MTAKNETAFRCFVNNHSEKADTKVSEGNLGICFCDVYNRRENGI